MSAKREKASQYDFEVLGLTSKASPDQVRKSYRELVKRWHPDHFQQRSVEEQRGAEEKLKELTAAYRRISECWAGLKNYQPQSRPASGPQPQKRPMTRKPQPAKPSSFKPRSPSPHWYQTAKKRQLSQFTEQRIGYLLIALLVISVIVAVKAFQPHKQHITALPSREYAKSKSLSSSGTRSSPQKLEKNSVPAEIPRDRNLSSKGANDQPASQDEAAQEMVVAKEYFTLGASPAEVRHIQGPPDKIRGQTWIYNLSEVQFKDGKVDRYNNFDGSLKIRLMPSQPNIEVLNFVTIGSTADEVLAIQGTPTRILDNTWYYGFSQIRFQDRRVVAYDNFFGNLNIRVLPSAQDKTPAIKSFFTIGSLPDEVLAVQGTPTSIQGNMWYYGFSNILFRDGRVGSVIDSSGQLRYQEPDT